MANWHKMQSSFLGGEISTRMLARYNHPTFPNAVLRMKNFMPTLQGTMIRSPGTRFVEQMNKFESEDMLGKTRIIPYKTNTNQNALIYLYKGGGQLRTDITKVLSENANGDQVRATSLTPTLVPVQIVPNSTFSGGIDPWVPSPDGELSEDAELELGATWGPGAANIRVRYYKHPGKEPTYAEITNEAVIKEPTSSLNVPKLFFACRLNPNPTIQQREDLTATIKIGTTPGGGDVYTRDFTDSFAQDTNLIITQWEESADLELVDGFTGTLYITCSLEAHPESQKYAGGLFQIQYVQIETKEVQSIGSAVLDGTVPYERDELDDIHFVQSPYTPDRDDLRPNKPLVLTHPSHPPQWIYWNGTSHVIEPIPFKDAAGDPVDFWDEHNYPATCTSYNGRLILAGAQSFPVRTNEGFVDTWLFEGIVESGTPTNQHWHHNAAGTRLAVDKTNTDEEDTTAALLELYPGSLIRLSEQTDGRNFVEFRTAQFPVDNGSFIEYETTLVNSGGTIPAEAITTMTVTEGAIIPIDSNSETIWGTEVGRWDKFSDNPPVAESGVNPDDSIEVTSIYRSPIQWAYGQKNLLVGALEMEYVVEADGIFAPGDLGINMHSTHGSVNVQPAGFGEVVMFPAEGGRRLRYMNINNDQQGWVAPDLTLYNPDILDSGIKRMVRLRNPHQMLVILKNDGRLAVMHFDVQSEDDKLFGWSRIDVQGQIEDIAVVPDENGFDTLFIAITRTVQGEKKRFLEAFANWRLDQRWDYTASTAVRVSSVKGGSYIWENLDHLRGLNVPVIADLQYIGTFKVKDNATVELIDQTGRPIYANTIFIGRPIVARCQTLPIIPSSRDGQDPGAKIRYSSLSVWVRGSTRPKLAVVSPEEDGWLEMERPADRDLQEEMKFSQPLDIVKKHKITNTGWDSAQTVLIEETLPLRCEILAVYGKVTGNSL